MVGLQAEYARILDSDRRCREQSALLKQAVIEVESLIETEATGSDSNPGVMAQDAETCQFKLASAEADLKYTLSHIKHLRFQVVQKQQETAEALNLADAISRLRRVHLNELRSLSVADLRNELISDLSHVVVEGVTELQALTDKELTQMARQHFLVKINPGIV